MSVMACNNCDRWIDVKSSPEEVIWVDDDGKPNNADPAYIVCFDCAEKIFTLEEMETYDV